MVIRLSVGAALIVLGSQTVAAQNDVSVDGYSVEGLRGYRDAAIEIENSYRFDDRHRDEIDAVSGGWNVLTVEREDEDGAHAKYSLIAHCNDDIPDGGKYLKCRYRLVVSGIEFYEPTPFDAHGAAARLRSAGITPAVFNALVQDVPPTMSAERAIERWGEVRSMHDIIITDVNVQFDKHHYINTVDSETCPKMLRPLRKIHGIALPPSHVHGLGNEPKYRASVPHSPIFSFSIRTKNGGSVNWPEANLNEPSSRIWAALLDMGNICRPQ